MLGAVNGLINRQVRVRNIVYIYTVRLAQHHAAFVYKYRCVGDVLALYTARTYPLLQLLGLLQLSGITRITSITSSWDRCRNRFSLRQLSPFKACLEACKTCLQLPKSLDSSWGHSGAIEKNGDPAKKQGLQREEVGIKTGVRPTKKVSGRVLTPLQSALERTECSITCQMSWY